MAEPKSISSENPPPEVMQVQPAESVISRVLGSTLRGLFTGILRIVFFCTDAWAKIKDLPGTNYDLGVRHLRNGNLVDAGLRFRMVLRMQPQHGLAWYQLGRTYLRQGKIAQGCEALRKALELNVKPEESKFLLACADDSFPIAQAPTSMPLSLVTEYFDFVAPAYNTMQREQFQYKGPQEAYKAVFSVVDKNSQTLRILDLGAATGQVAEKFRPHAVKIIGVDVSRGMTAVAQLARDSKDNLIFDEYHTMDLRRYLKEHPKERFNLVLAEDVFGNLGDLQEVFKEISDILAPQGVFAFTTEITAEQGHVLMRNYARFGHSQDYIRKLAQGVGLKEVYFEDAELYPEHTVHQWVLQKV